MKSTQITAFLEGVYANEAFYHEIEHRIFELEPWKTIEGDQECETEAFAYSTGILFRIRSFSYDAPRILQSFHDLMDGRIPEFSHAERKRFLQELKERNENMGEDFDERAGGEFLKRFENSPEISNAKKFHEVFSRIGILISDENGSRYEERRVANIPSVPKLVDEMPTLSGRAFHVYRFHPVWNAEGLAGAMISSNIVRNRLRKAFRDTGESYDVHMSVHYERNFLYSDYFWSWDKTKIATDFMGTPDREEFIAGLKQSLFYTKIGHEDRSFALNAILAIPPEAELAAYERMTYEKFIRILEENPPAHWWCGEK